MSIRKSMLLIGVVVGLGLSASQVLADSKTGQVSYYFMNTYPDGSTYTFVNVEGKICYTISNNTAFATIFAAKQITGSDVTINCNGLDLFHVSQ